MAINLKTIQQPIQQQPQQIDLINTLLNDWNNNKQYKKNFYRGDYINLRLKEQQTLILNEMNEKINILLQILLTTKEEEKKK